MSIEIDYQPNNAYLIANKSSSCNEYKIELNDNCQEVNDADDNDSLVNVNNNVVSSSSNVDATSTALTSKINLQKRVVYTKVSF